MNTGRSKQVRCAIYTRVSSDQGLEQDFNSLDAQYDASQAYIRSQQLHARADSPDRSSALANARPPALPRVNRRDLRETRPAWTAQKTVRFLVSRGTCHLCKFGRHVTASSSSSRCCLL
jgi:predicted NAD-dependent protein-ADP-ribosyltransferase YbiA (DUF1768 family)